MGTESGKSRQCSRWEGALIVADIRDVLTQSALQVRGWRERLGQGTLFTSQRPGVGSDGLNSAACPREAQLGEEEGVPAGPGFFRITGHASSSEQGHRAALARSSESEIQRSSSETPLRPLFTVNPLWGRI